MQTPWKYTDESRSVVVRTNDDGSMESCIAEREDVVKWVEEGNKIGEPDAPKSE